MTENVLDVVRWCAFWMAIVLVASLVTASAYPLLRRVIVDCQSRARSLVISAYGMLAPAVAGIVVLLLMWPELSSSLVPPHCHSGECQSHVPVFDVDSAGGLLLVMAGSLALFCMVAGCVYAVSAGRRWMLMLSAVSRKEPAVDCSVIDSQMSLAWCYGLWRPRVFLSSVMLERLAPQQLEVVLAHEQAHAERRDNLRAFALHWATAFYPPGARQLIRRDLAGAAEEACDLEAVKQVGNRSLVVSVIRRLEAEQRVTDSDEGMTANTVARIIALSREPGTFRSAAAAWLVVAGLFALQVSAVTGISHYLVEWVTTL